MNAKQKLENEVEKTKAWNDDKFILWALCYASRDELGIHLREIICKKVENKEYGSKILSEFIPKQCNYKKVGEDDSIRSYANFLGIEKYEKDYSKSVFCRFVKEKYCNKGKSCKYSHHPSLLWDETIEDLQQWLICDIEPFMFGMVFSLSKILMEKYDVVIKVPMKRDPNKDFVRIRGKNVEECLKKLEEIIKKPIKILDGNSIEKVNKKEYLKILKNIDFKIIGLEDEDPIRKKCKEMKIIKYEETDIIKKYKTTLCVYYKSLKCKNGNDCTYSHHPSMLWDYEPGEWNINWMNFENLLWGLCYTPRDEIGFKFREKLVYMILLGENKSYKELINDHIEWTKNVKIIPKIEENKDWNFIKNSKEFKNLCMMNKVNEWYPYKVDENGKIFKYYNNKEKLCDLKKEHFNKDSLILWVLCYAPDYNFRYEIAEKVVENKLGSEFLAKQLLNVINKLKYEKDNENSTKFEKNLDEKMKIYNKKLETYFNEKFEYINKNLEKEKTYLELRNKNLEKENIDLELRNKNLELRNKNLEKENEELKKINKSLSDFDIQAIKIYYDTINQFM
jgi:hypothetical protein